MTEQANGQFTYGVLFDDGYNKLYFYKDIIGPGFNTTSDLHLKHGQKVYMTHHGRELTGIVVRHNRASNDVYVEVECSNGTFAETVKRIDEIRLMESRKSARLNSANADVEVNQPSQRIDVPACRSKARTGRYVY